MVLVIATGELALEPVRGRPRDPSRDQAILDAAQAVIARKGFTGASMDEIARTAGVGKDTLYRRWPSKGRLVCDLISQLADRAVRPAPIDIDPRFDLFMYLKDVVRLNQASDFGALIAGVVGESVRNPEVAESFRAFWARRRRIAAGLVRDVVGPDVDDECVELLLDRLFAPVYYRLLLTGQDVTDEYLWHLVTELPWSDPPPEGNLA